MRVALGLARKAMGKKMAFSVWEIFGSPENLRAEFGVPCFHIFSHFETQQNYLGNLLSIGLLREVHQA